MAASWDSVCDLGLSLLPGSSSLLCKLLSLTCLLGMFSRPVWSQAPVSSWPGNFDLVLVPYFVAYHTERLPILSKLLLQVLSPLALSPWMEPDLKKTHFFFSHSSHFSLYHQLTLPQPEVMKSPLLLVLEVAYLSCSPCFSSSTYTNLPWANSCPSVLLATVPLWVTTPHGQLNVGIAKII